MHFMDCHRSSGHRTVSAAFPRCMHARCNTTFQLVGPSGSGHMRCDKGIFVTYDYARSVTD